MALKADPSALPSRTKLLVPLAALVLGLVGGIAIERRGETYRVEQRIGYVSTVHPSGDSLCLSETEPPAPRSEDCQNLRLVPGEEVPAIGTRVRAGFVFLPTQEGCCNGSWLYLVPEPE